MVTLNIFHKNENLAHLNYIVFWKNHDTSEGTDAFVLAKNLAQEMGRISQDSPYMHSVENYKDFCEVVLKQQTNFVHEISDKDIFVNNSAANGVFYALFLLRSDKTIIGFLNARIIYESVDIDFICIDKAYRKCGFGYFLFEKFQEKLRQEFLAKKQNYKIFLEVSTENFDAIAFYKKMNFVTVNIRSKYYANGEDAIIMQKCYS